MALDELHARRLATVASIFESALDRMELVLKLLEQGNSNSPLTAEQIQQARDRMKAMRGMLQQALERFTVRLDKPEPRQILAAELSTLWVVLENARPERMKGYGRNFAPQDKADWTNLIESLLREVEALRNLSRSHDQ